MKKYNSMNSLENDNLVVFNEDKTCFQTDMPNGKKASRIN
jgi:hypothetical protein